MQVRNLTYIIQQQHSTIGSLERALSHTVSEKEMKAAVKLCFSKIDFEGNYSKNANILTTKDFEQIKSELNHYAKKQEIMDLSGRINDMKDYIMNVCSSVYTGQFDTFSRQLALKANSEAVQCALSEKAPLKDFLEVSERVDILESNYGRQCSKMSAMLERYRAEILQEIQEQELRLKKEIDSHKDMLKNIFQAVAGKEFQDLASLLEKITNTERDANEAKRLAEEHENTISNLMREIEQLKRMRSTGRRGGGERHDTEIVTPSGAVLKGTVGDHVGQLHDIVRNLNDKSDLRLVTVEKNLADLRDEHNSLKRTVAKLGVDFIKETERSITAESRMSSKMTTDMEILAVGIRRVEARLGLLDSDMKDVKGDMIHNVRNAVASVADVTQSLQSTKALDTAHTRLLLQEMVVPSPRQNNSPDILQSTRRVSMTPRTVSSAATPREAIPSSNHAVWDGRPKTPPYCTKVNLKLGSKLYRASAGVTERNGAFLPRVSRPFTSPGAEKEHVAGGGGFSTLNYGSLTDKEADEEVHD